MKLGKSIVTGEIKDESGIGREEKRKADGAIVCMGSSEQKQEGGGGARRRRRLVG